MPEAPEVEALASFLTERVVGRVIARVDVAAINALKTFDPPPSSLAGLTVTGAARHGKFLALDVDGLFLVTHLSRAGWLHWRASLPATPLKPGKGPIALRVHLDDGSGFDLTEQGTQKRLAVYVVRSVSEVPGIKRLGIDVLDPSFTPGVLASLLDGQRTQVKGLLTDQSVLAGVGNAYSDEALWAARLSPYKIAATLTEAEVVTLWEALTSVVRDAVERSRGLVAGELKAEKKTGLNVHARTGLPCPRCGDVVREVSFATKSMQYCPTCQTGGKPLADRRMSKLLK